MREIIIKKSPTADTRTCDVGKVSSKELLAASKSHIRDVAAAMTEYARLINIAGELHDFTKLSHHNSFYRDFKNKFATQDWYDMHKREERHHLQSPDGVRDDVNLIDVLECVVDCVMAGLARVGQVRAIEIPIEVLLKAVQNTAEQLASNVIVEE